MEFAADIVFLSPLELRSRGGNHPLELRSRGGNHPLELRSRGGNHHSLGIPIFRMEGDDG